jgi:hypothetical protein
MALENELASFNIVMEKSDSSKIGCKRGCPKGKQRWATKGYTVAKAGTFNTQPLLTYCGKLNLGRIELRVCRLCSGGSCSEPHFD